MLDSYAFTHCTVDDLDGFIAASWSWAQCSSAYSGSRAQLSLEQIDGLLGTDLVNYIADSDGFASKSRWLTGNFSECDKHKANDAASLPSWATSFDDIAHFIYKHGFDDLLYEDHNLRGQSRATSRALARRRTIQEELLKSGVLRTLARLLKQIHDRNFYLSPHDKIANAFTITIEKHRVDRAGLSADWEFFAANHHPKIPPKDKIIYVQISQELSRRLTKSVTLSESSNFQTPALSSVSRTGKQSCIAKKKNPIPATKLGSTRKLIKKPRAQGNVVIKGRARQRQLKGATNCTDLPLRIKPRPSSSCSGLICKEGKGQIVKLRPSTVSKLKTTTPSGPRLGHHDKEGGHKDNAEHRSSNIKLRNGACDLPACKKPDFREPSLKNEPDGGLSTLARLEKLFPMPTAHKGDDLKKRAELQVEIDRLKILRWWQVYFPIPTYGGIQMWKKPKCPWTIRAFRRSNLLKKIGVAKCALRKFAMLLVQKKGAAFIQIAAALVNLIWRPGEFTWVGVFSSFAIQAQLWRCSLAYRSSAHFRHPSWGCLLWSVRETGSAFLSTKPHCILRYCPRRSLFKRKLFWAQNSFVYYVIVFTEIYSRGSFICQLHSKALPATVAASRYLMIFWIWGILLNCISKSTRWNKLECHGRTFCGSER